MGFPQSFKFDHGARRNRIRLIGNAVCPPVMKAVIQALIDSAWQSHRPVSGPANSLASRDNSWRGVGEPKSPRTPSIEVRILVPPIPQDLTRAETGAERP